MCNDGDGGRHILSANEVLGTVLKALMLTTPVGKCDCQLHSPDEPTVKQRG